MKSTAKLVEGCFQSIVDNGGHHGLVVDLPGNKGGQDVAPTALELAVMALSGCISTIWAVVAKNSGVSFHKFTVEVEADKPADQLTIVGVSAVVKIESSEKQETLERTLDKVMRTCPVGLLYEKASLPVKTTLVRLENTAAGN